ncbi:hypothetical protein PAMC26510_16725 [Caballeronia sordidicola]|uniref:Uncharacterized protein n=1 Tax=Caballeronia sordidicola TaxID=196367 RepID=A0A242MSK3_CABSO|nr:hypothetical protein PAMC26510_16725 [Caballeronia sordidicola]
MIYRVVYRQFLTLAQWLAYRLAERFVNVSESTPSIPFERYRYDQNAGESNARATA